MKAKSIRGKSPGEIQAELQECMLDGFKPTLAIVFLSVNQDRNRVRSILANEGIQVLGATSLAEFANGYQASGSIVILLLDPPVSSFTIYLENIGERDTGAVGNAIARAALQKFKRPSFILCSTSATNSGEFLDGESLVREIEASVGPEASIYGGMAGDDYTITGTYVFTHEMETVNGVAALVFDEDRISLNGMAVSGWKPLGIERTVTKSNGGLVYSIDGQPALDMYLKYLGLELKTEEEKYKAFESIGVHYPFQVERESGEPVMRTPLKFNRQFNAIACDFNVPEGSRLRFSMPPDFDIVEEVLDKARDLKELNPSGADALLIFSCAGRLSALGPMANMENEGLTEIWNVPMAGFFTYGEFGRAINGKHEFHSTTCCWVAIKEK